MPKQVNVVAQVNTSNAIQAARFGYLNGIPVLQYDPVSAREMGIAGRMTLAQFLALTKVSFKDGALVHVFDVHGLMGFGGITFRWDSVAGKFGGQSEPIVFATLDLAPNPALVPGLVVFILSGCGIGGALLKSNGVSYRYLTRSRVILASGVDVLKTTTAGAIYTEEALLTCTIPINNGKSLLQPGDRLFIDHHSNKTGSADKFSRDFRFGTSATPASNTSLDQFTASSASATTGEDEMIAFRCIDDTHLRKEGPVGLFSYNGGTNTGRSTSKAVTSINSALQYFSCTYNLTSVGGTDTAMKLEAGVIYIEHCGA